MTERKAGPAAFLFLTPSAYPGKFNPLHCKVFGLTVLERTLKALQAGGTNRVCIIAEDPVDQVKEQVSTYEGLNLIIDVRSRSELDRLEDEALGNLSTGQGLVILTEPMIIDAKLSNWLVEESMKRNHRPVSSLGGKVIYFPPTETNLGLVSLKAFIRGSSHTLTSVEEVPFSLPLGHTVSNDDELEVVRAALIKSLIKPTDGWVSRNLNRPISTRITRILAGTSITPNQFTIFTGFIGVLTGYFLAQGPYWGFMLGSFLFHLTSVLDGVDGELARLKFMSSPYGQWLDTIVDNSSYVIALVGYIIGLYSDGVTTFESIAGYSAVTFTLLALASMYYYLKRFKRGGSLLNIEFSYKSGKSIGDRILRMLAPLGKRDLFALIFFLMGLFGILHLALIFIAALSATMFALSIQAHLRGIRSPG